MKRYFLGIIAIVCLTCLSITWVFAKEHEAKATFMKAPLSFIKNDGQKDPSILFYEQGWGHATAFSKEGIFFSFSKLSKIKDKGQSSEIVALSPLNASLSIIEPNEQREGKVNYFIGKDSSGWKSNISTYGAILYKNVYPGIDMKFYGTNSQLEYDIIVAPGSDPSRIRLAYTGVERLLLVPTGDLEISLKEGSLIQKKPFVYQVINGIRKEIEGKFVVAGSTYGFDIGPYDKNHLLVIDPILIYSTYLGGTGADNALGVAVDSTGNVYVAGQTSSFNFPSQNPYQGSYGGGNYDAFVTKYDSSGILVYSTFLGGYDEDCANAIAVDSSGNAYITGYTYSANFPTQNPYQNFNAGNADVFVTKVGSSGNPLVYSTYLGGSYDDIAYGIAVDASNNSYVTGYTYSSNFPTEDAYQSINAGSQDVFVTKLNSAGNALVYSTYLGGGSLEAALSITVDITNNAYITGYTWSDNYPTQNAYQNSLMGMNDVFITKLNPSGGALVYSTYLGGSDNDYAWGVAVDVSGNAYVTGSTGSYDFPTQNAYQPSSGGDNDAFVSKLSSSGTSLIYSTYLGGYGYDEAFGIKVDSTGSAYVAGYTYSYNFPIKKAYQDYFGGYTDAFITKVHPTGDSLVFSTYLGGNSLDCVNAIAIDSSGSAYVAGVTASDNFPTQNPYQGYNAGSIDAFVSKLTPGYWLTVDKSGYGSVSSDPPGIYCGTFDSYSTHEFLKGQAITLTAVEEPFSTFVGWSGGGCSGIGTCIVNSTEDVTVTATFKTYALMVEKNGTGSGTVVSNPPGIDCGTDCIDVYGQGKLITLTPIPDLFSAIVGWSGGGCSGTDVCILNLMEDVTVTATFDLSPKEGTVGTQITSSDSRLGPKRGKILIGGATTKIISWTSASVTFEVKKTLTPGLYPAVIAPKGMPTITLPGVFIMKAPEIVSVDSSGQPGNEKTLSGNFFGSKKGKIYLEDQSTGQKKNCKVTSWSMDKATGASSIKFLVPKPKGYVPGVSTTYNLKVTNKVGTATTTFIID